MDPPIVFSPTAHSHLLPEIVAIHQACIVSSPYAIQSFVPPFKPNEMETWWEARILEHKKGLRKIILQMVTNKQTGKEELAGVITLDMKPSNTAPHRASVEKLLVSPEHRRKGIARRLVENPESIARIEGKTLLLLHTDGSSPAATMYLKLSYIEFGMIPDYFTWWKDGSLKAASFFYKNLLTADGK